MKNLQITITLEEDRKTINLIDISGCNHYMWQESDEEKEHYQNMTVAEFIEDYVKYYESVEEVEEHPDLSTFVLLGESREEAYDAHIEFEMGFDDPRMREIMSFNEFCKELDLGYGKSGYIQIARLYEDKDGKIWYDNEYVG